MRLLLLLAAVLTGPALATDAVQRGVLIDRDNAQVLLMRPTGGIEAVDIRSGATRWTSEEADLPVVLQGGAVLALGGPAKRGVLPYAFLDLADGRTLGKRFGDLTAPARALVDDRLGETFSTQPTVDGFAWHYRHERITGALMGRENTEPVSEEEAMKAPVDVGHEGDETGVSLSGAVSVDLASHSLRSRELGQAKLLVDHSPIEIGTPHATGPRLFRSNNGGHSLESLREDDGRYRWTVRNGKGAILGTLRHAHSYLAFEVLDGVLLYVTPLGAEFDGDEVTMNFPTLVAFDLADGRLLWTREIRDTEFRGPYPP